MSDTQPLADVIMGHEVIDILREHPGPLAVEALRAEARTRFGASAVFGNCHGDRFDFDGLLEFLAAAGKLARRGEMVGLGHVPACSGHDEDHGH